MNANDCDRESTVCPAEPAGRLRIWRRGRPGLIVAVVLSLILTGSWWWYDFHMVEKMLTRLAMPCGIIWMGLFANAMNSLHSQRRTWRVASWTLLGFFWVATSTLTGDLIMGLLERRYAAVDPRTVEPFDTIVVLGGATMSDPQDHVWLGIVGDRVMLAARLYAQGKVKQLVTTGVVQRWGQRDSVDMSEATDRIWRELGIPSTAITQIGGVNTSQELKNIKQLLGDQPPARVGLLTSAFHLPRAERLARQNGVAVIPIPAGFLSPVNEPLPLAVIPHYYGITMTDLAAKEFLAALFSR